MPLYYSRLARLMPHVCRPAREGRFRDQVVECQASAPMTRSKEMRRIEAALSNKEGSELRWALAQCELRKQFMKRHSARLLSA